jgi:hypothetical protein
MLLTDGLRITLDEKPAAAVLTYRKAKWRQTRIPGATAPPGQKDTVRKKTLEDCGGWQDTAMNWYPRD